jgi:hypothetical protein
VKTVKIAAVMLIGALALWLPIELLVLKPQREDARRETDRTKMLGKQQLDNITKDIESSRKRLGY